ncbi:MAG: 4-hydroxythreonine-4-phosphate dehydrogenase PdxA [Pseudomonadota bacterium]
MPRALKRPRIAISAGEPAGIGPDIVLAAAGKDWNADLVVIADRDMLERRAAELGLRVSLPGYEPQHPQDSEPVEREPGASLQVLHCPLSVSVNPGVGDARNASGVLAALQRATEGCESGEFSAMVTAPVNKAVIADSGVPFSGHTEFLAELTGTSKVVMLLAARDLRVALATTHIPLAEVPRAVASAPLGEIIQILHSDLQTRFGFAEPRIAVLGLNPHAGENGYLGREDIDIIGPAIHEANARGMNVTGPWPADTAFNSRLRQETDAYLAMYHDQGLPVLKFASFGAAVNITLGLPILRTSVDHGTAFDLAASGGADSGSFFAALEMAIELSRKR